MLITTDLKVIDATGLKIKPFELKVAKCIIYSVYHEDICFSGLLKYVYMFQILIAITMFQFEDYPHLEKTKPRLLRQVRL